MYSATLVQRTEYIVPPKPCSHSHFVLLLLLPILWICGFLHFTSLSWLGFISILAICSSDLKGYPACKVDQYCFGFLSPCGSCRYGLLSFSHTSRDSPIVTSRMSGSPWIPRCFEAATGCMFDVLQNVPLYFVVCGYVLTVMLCYA